MWRYKSYKELLKIGRSQERKLNTPKKLKGTGKNSQRHSEGWEKLKGDTRLDGDDCNN